MSLQNYIAAGLGPRIVTGIILLAVVFSAWTAGGLPLFLLLLVISCLGQWECYSLFLPHGEVPARLLGIVLGAGLVTLCRFHPEYPSSLALTAAFILLAIHSLAGWTQEDSVARFRRAAILLGGIVYIPLLLAPVLHYSPGEQLFIVLVPALSDIAAYAAGVQFGKHRIWPSVSPKKSTEGAAAGLIAAILAALVAGYLLRGADFSFLEWAFLGLFMGIMAQLGDFFESALKRAAHIKDSGKILPGHGGVLDRIDSILFASAAFALARPFLG